MRTISPVRSLMALLFGWIIIVPPFIAMYNTAQHIQRMEDRTGVQQQISPAVAVVLLLIISLRSPTDAPLKGSGGPSDLAGSTAARSLNFSSCSRRENGRAK